MANELRKIELMEWVRGLEDNATLELLQALKDSRNPSGDWFDAISEEERAGINRGLADMKAGRTIPHSEVARRYGL